MQQRGVVLTIGVGLCFVLVLVFGVVVRGSFAQPTTQVFGETGYTVREPFLSFWRAGGVERFGYPISAEIEEHNPDDGKAYITQYFERVRLEHHPDESPPVQISRLGAHYLEQPPAKQLSAMPPAAGAITAQLMAVDSTDCLHFVETTEELCGVFAEYWQQNGGVAMLGYPLSLPVMYRTEDGRLLVVQYTERARLEVDPQSQTISLGLLGREHYGTGHERGLPGWAQDPTRAHLISLINQARAAAGLEPVAPAPELMSAAQNHSQDMALSGLVSHVGSDGRAPQQRMHDVGYMWQRCGENIAVGQTTPEEAMQFWMNSPPHRANILDPGMREVGVGYVQQASGYGHYWTINLGER